MKISERWLQEWIKPTFSREALFECLTMAGLEIESVSADGIIDIAITPNRGDCLSVLGLSKEISALTKAVIHIPSFMTKKPTLTDTLSVTIKEPKECPHYVGRVIRGVKADMATPEWLAERLRVSDIKCIHPIVDVMNYVMLELGQPMHAFDLQKIKGGIHVRLAKSNEPLELLDGRALTLNKNTLVIADDQSALAIAGVMGGLFSSVTLDTKDIFLESAFFNPACITSAGRDYQLTSDSSYRFLRGVDPSLQVRAIERATELILEITGGAAGPIIDVMHQEYLPADKTILLRAERAAKLLGLTIPAREIEDILERLGFSIIKKTDGWQVTVPARRFDITTEIDLIEEVARIFGYEKIPLHSPSAALQSYPLSEKKLSLSAIRNAFVDSGYHEVITYSFIDPRIQALFNSEIEPKPLLNPMTLDMSVMRTSLWPGLVNTLLYNQNRQQQRVRIFETGLRFLHANKKLIQEQVIAGLISGSLFPEQWGIPARNVDFFDVKGDLENVLKLTFSANEFEFRTGYHEALHRGQTAEIYYLDQKVGIMGAIHPGLAKKLDISGPVFLFECLLEPIKTAKLPHFEEISKFPEIRRDIAILVDRAFPAHAIQDTISHVAGNLLRQVSVFDLYQGKGILPDRKSIALALTLQHPSRTLVDEEVAELMERIIVALKEKFAAELRG
ncbi:MAG TPA: phenylalanine--tRNA ligase subunit beta [Gammaproteobacteria bacterium]|nr:phenylalanine--tRNA ligase subunit beta [Gammaproteobacteria bacterium]